MPVLLVMPVLLAMPVLLVMLVMPVLLVMQVPTPPTSRAPRRYARRAVGSAAVPSLTPHAPNHQTAIFSLSFDLAREVPIIQ